MATRHKSQLRREADWKTVEWEAEHDTDSAVYSRNEPSPLDFEALVASLIMGVSHWGNHFASEASEIAMFSGAGYGYL